MLYMKVGRIINTPTYAWLNAVAGERAIGRNPATMRQAEAEDFSYAEKQPDRTTLGAGGVYEYRAYDLLGDVKEGYAIVRPTSAKMRMAQDFPDMCSDLCRVVNINTGVESSLCNNLVEALELQRMAAAGELLGSFN